MKRILAALALAWLAVSPARAWWDMGHMEVAAIAYGHLSDPVRKRVDELIRHHLGYPLWTKGLEGLPDIDLAQQAFVHAATWADDIKGTLNCATLGAPGCYSGSPVDDPKAPTDSQNIGTADHFIHAYWHYYDVPFSPDNTPSDPAPPVNALTQIRSFTAALADPKKSDDVKSYDLVWLLHLVGDAHQPLHATARYTAAIPKGDAGGNSEMVTVGGVQPIALHAFWDGLLGDRGPASAAIAAASLLPNADPALAAESDPEKWFIESEDLAEKNAYTGIGPDKGPYPLSADYMANAKTIAGKQVALAGLRLANLIEAGLK